MDSSQCNEFPHFQSHQAWAPPPYCKIGHLYHLLPWASLLLRETSACLLQQHFVLGKHICENSNFSSNSAPGCVNVGRHREFSRISLVVLGFQRISSLSSYFFQDAPMLKKVHLVFFPSQTWSNKYEGLIWHRHVMVLDVVQQNFFVRFGDKIAFKDGFGSQCNQYPTFQSQQAQIPTTYCKNGFLTAILP